jgi:hypothetical protein
MLARPKNNLIVFCGDETFAEPSADLHMETLDETALL